MVVSLFVCLESSLSIIVCSSWLPAEAQFECKVKIIQWSLKLIPQCYAFTTYMYCMIWFFYFSTVVLNQFTSSRSDLCCLFKRIFMDAQITTSKGRKVFLVIVFGIQRLIQSCCVHSLCTVISLCCCIHSFSIKSHLIMLCGSPWGVCTFMCKLHSFVGRNVQG